MNIYRTMEEERSSTEMAKKWSERGQERICHRGPKMKGLKKQEVVSGKATERARRSQAENIH